MSQKRGRAELKPMSFRTIVPIVRVAGLVPTTIAFAVHFVLASAVVAVCEPAFEGFADAAWYMFAVVTTIGFGDFTCITFMGRLMTVLLSIYSVFYMALIAGAVVSYCSERMKAMRDESVAEFIDQLERLPELSKEELEAISAKVRSMH